MRLMRYLARIIGLYLRPILASGLGVTMKYFQAPQPLLDVSATARYGWVIKKAQPTFSEKTTEMETLSELLDAIGFRPSGRASS
jgi:hypothetical protein